MAGRSAAISVSIKGESDFTAARREAARALDQIGDLADETTDDIRRAFDSLSPEIDTTEIRKALDLADQLDGMAATFDLETQGLDDIKQMEALAKSLRGFQARVDLSVEGREELKDALGLADKMDGIRRLKVELQGQEDLKRAAAIADDLERRRTVNIDVDDSQLLRLDDEITAAGERGADGLSGALGDLDLSSMEGQIQDGITGALAGAGAVGAAVALFGQLVGDEVAAGVKDGFNRASEEILTAARFGLSEAEIEEIGRATGGAFDRGFGESLSGLRETGAILESELGDLDAELDLSTAIPAAETLAQIWGVDIPESARLARNLVAQGLAPDTITAYRQMADAAQTYRGDQDEVFDTVSELTSMFARMGIDGSRGFAIVGDAAKSGQIEVGQMAELFEEFVGQITDGSAQDAIESIGLNWEETQARFANGEGAEVMSDINERLLTMKDRAQANTIAADLYGEAWAKVADPEIVLAILAQADAQGEVRDALDEGTAAVERSTTEWDKAKRTLQEFAGVASEEAATAFNQLAGGVEQLADGFGLWGDASDNVQGKLEAVANLVGFGLAGPLGVFADDVGDAAARMLGLGDGAEKVAHKLEKAGETGGSAGRRFDEAADGADALAGGLDEASIAADELEAELRGLFDFSADQLFRDIAEAGDELAETLKNGGAEAVGMGGAIDISTEAGRKLQAQMEGLTDILIEAGVAQADGSITADQLASAHSILRGQLESTGAAAGLTAGEVDDLIAKYLNVPSEVVTNLRAQDNATAVVKNLQTELSKLKDKTITVTTRNAIIAATAATTQFRERARGGWTEGLTLVGEEGPELIDVRGRAFVHTAAETRELMSNRGGNLAGAPSAATAATRPQIYIDKWVVDKGRDSWQDLQLAQLVYG